MDSCLGQLSPRASLDTVTLVGPSSLRLIFNTDGLRNSELAAADPMVFA